MIIKKLEKQDVTDGFLQVLNTLRETNLDYNTAQEIFEKINDKNHIIFIAKKDDIIIGSTTLLVEQKFIHSGGLVGHIEDVVVLKEKQGKDIGKQLIKHALNYAKKQGCYKTILDCSNDTKLFYEKLGFRHNSNAMRFDHT